MNQHKGLEAHADPAQSLFLSSSTLTACSPCTSEARAEQASRTNNTGRKADTVCSLLPKYSITPSSESDLYCIDVVHHQMLHNVLEALKKAKKSQSNRGKQTLVIGVHVVCSSKQHKSLYNSQHASLGEWVQQRRRGSR